MLAVSAVVSFLYASKWGERAIQLSAAFVCFMLAVAFVSPVGAFVVAVAAELGTWAIQRYRIVALPVNLAASAVPSLLAGIAFYALVGGRMEHGSIDEIAALALVGVGPWR